MFIGTTSHVPRWSNGGDIRVLVVDDERVVALPLVAGLNALGVQATAVHNATDALSSLIADPGIGVVVTDIRMPGGDGLALAQTIFSRYVDTMAVEVIVITGHASSEDVARALSSGAADLLRKPFRLNEAFQALLKVMAHVSERRRIAADLAPRS